MAAGTAKGGETGDAHVAALIERCAREAGFQAVGFAPARLPASTSRQLFRFVSLKRHGTMDWMAQTAVRRGQPVALWPDARTVIVLGMNYGPDTDPLAALERTSHAAISVYAQGKDYHVVAKKRAKQVARTLANTTGAQVKVFVDTAPVMEKPLAERAGIGWQGKHTNLVSRDHGSWLFLATIFTDLAIDPELPLSRAVEGAAANGFDVHDHKATSRQANQLGANGPQSNSPDHCGACTRCLDICPTNAFPAPYQLDARRCISYLTIEHRGPIPSALRRPMGNRIFGCDDCLAVCPWNKFAAAAQEQRFAAREGTANPPLADLLAMDEAGFHDRFAGTPVKRAGYAGLIRNVLIAAGNSGDGALIPAVRQRLNAPEPLLRGAAVWALSELDRALALALRPAYSAGETDPDVQGEWHALEGEPDDR